MLKNGAKIVFYSQLIKKYFSNLSIINDPN